MERVYRYGYWGSRPGLKHALFVLITFVPLPYWANLVFGIQIQQNAVLLTFLIGGLIIMGSIYSDKKYRNYFQPIEINDDGIIYHGIKNTTKLNWNLITDIEKVRYSDLESKLVFGLSGMKVKDQNNNKIIIFNTLNGYHEIINEINSNIRVKNT